MIRPTRILPRLDRSAEVRPRFGALVAPAVVAATLVIPFLVVRPVASAPRPVQPQFFRMVPPVPVPPVIPFRVTVLPRADSRVVPAPQFIQTPSPPAVAGTSPVIPFTVGQWRGDERASKGEVRPRFERFPFFEQPPRIRHPRARGVSQAPRAGAVSQAPEATAGLQEPRAGLASQTRLATGKGQAPRGVTGSQAAGAASLSRAPRAVTVADLPKLRVRFASQGPRATIRGGSPQATVTMKNPKGEGD